MSSHLQNALQHISSWMTANLLTLNSSKTEFLLIGLKNQLAKIHNSSLDTPNSARMKSWLYLWRTSYFIWPNYISLQSLLPSQRATISGTSCRRRWPTWSACSAVSKYQQHIRRRGTSGNMDEMYLTKIIFIYASFWEVTYRSDPSMDFHAWWRKRRGLAQGCAFLGFLNI